MRSARKGKIGRLPAAIRDQVNQRLYDGQTAGEIIRWLHGIPEVIEILERHFEGQPMNDQNITEWRQGGYEEWLVKHERVQHLKTLSDYALKLAKASGGKLSEGAAAIAGGKILELLESADGNDITDLATALMMVRTGESTEKKIALQAKRLDQKDREIALARDKFEVQTVEQFIKWGRSKEAQDILASGKPKQVQMELLREMMFGPVKS